MHARTPGTSSDRSCWTCTGLTSLEVLRFLWWNRYPSRKPAWYREGSHRDLPWGLPVLEHAKSLLARVYHLPPTIEEELISRVEAEGGASFLQIPVGKPGTRLVP